MQQSRNLHVDSTYGLKLSMHLTCFGNLLSGIGDRCPVPEKWQKLSQTWVIIVQKKWNGNWCNFLVVTGAQKIRKTFWFHLFIKKIKHNILSVWEVLQKYSYKRRYIKKVMNLPTFNPSPIGPLPPPPPPPPHPIPSPPPPPPPAQSTWRVLGKIHPPFMIGSFPFMLMKLWNSK